MKTLTKLLSATGIALAALSSQTVLAANLPITWDLSTAAYSGGTATVTSGGHTLKVRSYFSLNETSGAFAGATVTNQGSSGMGILNPNETNTSPNHAIDNYGQKDLMLLEFDDFFSAQAFSIGWGEFTSGTARPDIDVWTGPNLGHPGVADNANLNLNGACFSGCATTLASLGFTKTTFNDVSAGTSKGINAAIPSRYVLVSGALGSGANDAFKLKSLTGVLPTNTSLPEPATILSFGLLSLGLLAARRRQK